MPFLPNGSWIAPTQSVNNNNPSSVQNYLSNINQNPAAASQNQQMNAPQMRPMPMQQNIQAVQNTGVVQPTINPNLPQSFGQQAASLGIYGNQNAPQINPTMAMSSNGQQFNPLQATSGILGRNYMPVGGYTSPFVGNQELPNYPDYQTPWQVQQNNAQQQVQTVPGASFQGSHYSTSAPLGSTSSNSSTYLSDETKKENIAPGDEKLDEFLNALGVYSYEYKDKRFGEGERISPMAQEIEKSDIGKQAVIETQHGKMVNYGALAGAQLAATAMLHHRQQEFEKKFDKLMKEHLIKKK